MPKRIIDGEGLWRSDKLAKVEQRWRPEYANLIPLALANGTFELNARRIWSQVYAYNRPEITVEDVTAILENFEAAKLLFRWSDQQSGKEWGYWTGSQEKPGRLPAASRRGNHEVVGPEPPADDLRKFLDSVGQPLVSQTETKGCLGLGVGLGLGMGGGADSNGIREVPTSNPKSFNPTEVAQILCQKNGWSGADMIWALQSAIEFQSKQMPETGVEEVGEWLAMAYFEQKKSKGTYAVGPRKFFEQGLYASAADRKEATANIVANNPATRALAQMEAS